MVGALTLCYRCVWQPRGQVRHSDNHVLACVNNPSWAGMGPQLHRRGLLGHISPCSMQGEVPGHVVALTHCYRCVWQTTWPGMTFRHPCFGLCKQPQLGWNRPTAPPTGHSSVTTPLVACKWSCTVRDGALTHCCSCVWQPPG